MPPCALGAPRLTDYLPPSWSSVGVTWGLLAAGLFPLFTNRHPYGAHTAVGVLLTFCGLAYLRGQGGEKGVERGRRPWDVLQDQARDGALKGQGLAVIREQGNSGRSRAARIGG